MAEHKNPEVFFVHNSEDVTVTIKFLSDKGCSEKVNLLNAADALKFFAESGYHKSWTKSIEVD